MSVYDQIIDEQQQTKARYGINSVRRQRNRAGNFQS